jgi:hypothetical protein
MRSKQNNPTILLFADDSAKPNRKTAISLKDRASPVFGKVDISSRADK